METGGLSRRQKYSPQQCLQSTVPRSTLSTRRAKDRAKHQDPEEEEEHEEKDKGHGGPGRAEEKGKEKERPAAKLAEKDGMLII